MISYFQDMYDIPDENVKGHRDWSPDLDGDGEIEQNEWLKDCPCFNVREFMDNDERKFK
jgi:N-acetylmuramoyl-L-alanine amidase